MSTNFFSHKQVVQNPPSVDDATAIGALEQQQALLVGALRRAVGQPVSYDELRDAGIEFPASVVSELELAGLPVERCYEGPLGARRLIGVRLDRAPEKHGTPVKPTDDRPAPRPQPKPSPAQATVGEHLSPARGALAARTRPALRWIHRASGIVRRDACGAIGAVSATSRVLGQRTRQALAGRAPEARLARREPGARRSPPSELAHAFASHADRAGARWLAPAALVVTVAVAAAVALGQLAGGGHLARAPRHDRHPQRTPSAASSPRRATPTQPSPTTQPATPVSPVLATQLETRGHDLLQAGQLEHAIPVLRAAVAATGERLASCLQPASETCLTYAYALYDLGRTLRLAGRPGVAVPVLERRLQISNQRATVEGELALARREAGTPPSNTSTTG
jgi:hypothetical protein